MERRPFAALEAIPVVGRFWADALEIGLAMVDAANISGTRGVVTQPGLPVQGPAPVTLPASNAPAEVPRAA